MHPAQSPEHCSRDCQFQPACDAFDYATRIPARACGSITMYAIGVSFEAASGPSAGRRLAQAAGLAVMLSTTLENGTLRRVTESMAMRKPMTGTAKAAATWGISRFLLAQLLGRLGSPPARLQGSAS